MKCKRSCSPPPPPQPPPLPTWMWRRKLAVKSVTREEIERFWWKKRMEEEHLLAAQKAAALIRARTLTKEEYKSFEESLKDTISNSRSNGDDKAMESDCNREVRLIIKDWWTKSRYAYLNQPYVESMDEMPKRISTYIPNSHFYASSLVPPASMLGVF